MKYVTRNTLWVALVIASCSSSIGCMGPILRHQSPESTFAEEVPSDTTLVANVAHPYGMGYVKLEAIGLVTGLANTGEDPPPSPQRATILSEMNRRNVETPNQILASSATALVLVRGFLRPGIQEGDRFDIEVKTPTRSSTTSLRGGKLLETRMTEMAVLGSQIRKGHLMGVSNGSVLVDPTANIKDDPALARRGRILGGGIVTKSRKLGLILDHERQSVRLSQQVGKAINTRFHSYINGRRRGVATPKTDEFIELELHPRYKDNVGRFMQVVRNISLRESQFELQSRLRLLKSQLLDPVTSATAAIRLEAVGSEEAITILKLGLNAEDPEVRFYAAEALAYLDVTDAVAPLALIAREEPAFRVHALAALSAMDDGSAYDELRELLSVKSAETRYGAFRSLWAMSPGDSMIRGESLGEMFSYHILNVSGPPMIHVTNSHRPEIVLFGQQHRLKLPLVLDAGPKILVNGLSGGEIKVSRFSETTQQRVVSTDVDEVIRAVVELGGTYPDVVQMLAQAKESGAMASRFRVNALPESGREFLKSDEDSSSLEKSSESAIDSFDLETPAPELFSRRG